jgi:hypothetical protein
MEASAGRRELIEAGDYAEKGLELALSPRRTSNRTQSRGLHEKLNQEDMSLPESSSDESRSSSNSAISSSVENTIMQLLSALKRRKRGGTRLKRQIVESQSAKTQGTRGVYPEEEEIGFRKSGSIHEWAIPGGALISLVPMTLPIPALTNKIDLESHLKMMNDLLQELGCMQDGDFKENIKNRVWRWSWIHSKDAQKYTTSPGLVTKHSCCW